MYMAIWSTVISFTPLPTPHELQSLAVVQFGQRCRVEYININDIIFDISHFIFHFSEFFMNFNKNVFIDDDLWWKKRYYDDCLFLTFHYNALMVLCCFVSCACISCMSNTQLRTSIQTLVGWLAYAAPYRKYRLWCKKTFFTVGNHNNINCLNAYDYLYEWSERMNGWMKCFIDCGHLFIVSSACISTPPPPALEIS